MKINDRLKKIGDLVDKDSLVLDVGCDHALLSIYLVKEKKHKRVVASDISEGPLESARENIKKYNVIDNIELRLGDGLDTYTNDIDTVIISGMGGRTMIGILKNNIKKVKNINKFILSPNNYQQDVRVYLTSIGFFIEDEYFVKDGKIIYQIIIFKKGKCHLSKKETFFGPILLKKKDKLFLEYYNRELLQRNIILKLLPKNFYLRRHRIKKEIKQIEQELDQN